MRRTLVLMVGVAVMVLGLGVPAAADPPVEFSLTTTFEDLNPCDPPNTQVVTIVFNFKVHVHRNNTVVVIDSSASTDAGFMGNGHETQVLTKNNFLATNNFVLTHPETGEKFTVKLNLKVVQGMPQVDNFRFNCVKDV